MIDMSTTSLTEQKHGYAEIFDDRVALDYLKKSEVVRLVLSEKYTPEDVDNAFRNLRKRVQELEHRHLLDVSQISAYRQQIDVLKGPIG